MRFATTPADGRDAQRSWFEPSNLGPNTLTAPNDEVFVRLWQGFMTARVLMALAISLLQLVIVALGQAVDPVVLMLCAAYVAATLGMRLKGQPLAVGQTFGRQWLLTAGVDIAMCSLLQLLQPGTLNYTPLFAMPLLLVAVLGSLRLALGTAAGIALLVLAGAAWASWSAPSEAAPRYVEAALVATAYFVMALVVNQLAARLAQEERLARRNQSAAQLQTQVNELVIETLADGVAVVDRDGIARALNPAARAMLGSMQQTARVPFGLSAEPGWWPLLDLVQAAFEDPRSKPADVVIDHAAQGLRRLVARACACCSCTICARWKHACAPKNSLRWAACRPPSRMRFAIRSPPSCRPTRCSMRTWSTRSTSGSRPWSSKTPSGSHALPRRCWTSHGCSNNNTTGWSLHHQQVCSRWMQP